MLALFNLHLHHRMTEAHSTSRHPAAQGEPVAPSNAYKELARVADRELREWIRRRVERRAENRQTGRKAERGLIPD